MKATHSPFLLAIDHFLFEVLRFDEEIAYNLSQIYNLFRIILT
jgi:hypothetical protein